ncbi:MAG TPA: DUF2070 family protein [Candidatus Thermoplasmatota archaeon]|nr:DUF2070 family protein [Candidatus Thermoplasmatota archaeon]
MGASHGRESENSIQASVERSAAVSRVVFNAPPVLISYGYVIAASLLFGLALDPRPAGALRGLLLVGIPALVAGPLSAPLARALGGTLYYKRAAFLAAVGVTLVGATILLGVPLRIAFDVDPAWPVLFGYMGISSVRHAVLYATSDNRHFRTLPVSLLQTAIGIPLIAYTYGFGPDEVLLTALLPVVFLAPLIFFLEVFDTPLKKGFNVSASELFRTYIDHLTTGSFDGEAVISRFAEPIRAKFALAAFRREDRSLKAVVVVPALHPGPIGKLGGGDLPGKIAEALPGAELVMVPHGSATHDFNPASTREVERLAEAVRASLQGLTWSKQASPAVTAGTSIRVTSQVLGEGALLTYTSWPEPIDDVEYGVGLAAELHAMLSGPRAAAFIDCHNALVPGAGAVFLCTSRADTILDNARAASAGAWAKRSAEVRVGIAQDRTTFSKADGIGDQGVQVLVTDVDGQRFAYVLWDGNNAVPEVTAAIGRELKGVVDGFQVMTTDNHSVNAVAGAYGPVGHLVAPERVANATRLAVQRALGDLEPVECGFGRGVVEDMRVFGHQKTVQLTASINVMTSIMLQLIFAVLTIQALGSALLFYMLRFGRP